MKIIPVLIIGAGPVGVSLALALARQNVHSIVLERHPGITEHPRARGVNVRSMELFRQWGNREELLNYEQPKEARRFIWAHSLQGEEITRIAMEDSDISLYSPAQASLVTQDHVETSLYHTLLNYPQTKIKFSKEFISFEENASGITARILNKEKQQEEFIQAQYLIAADGAHSGIRKQLAIAMEGPENLGKFCSVYCEMDILQWTKHRRAIGYFFTDPMIMGKFLAAAGNNRWIIGIRFTEINSKSDFTDEYCIKEIKKLVNLADLPIKIINKSFWTMAAQIATQYRKGRAFLIGDAAHRLPPTGGFGMNTGIQDAHNLAWKLAMVLNHNISDKLLNTYYDERAPIATQNIKWSTENAALYREISKALSAGDSEMLKTKLHEQQRTLNFMGLDLGFIYHSNVIISENDQQLSITPATYVPTSLPGIRAPHLPLVKNNETISSLDLFEKNFVLLTGAEGEAWQKALKKLANALPIVVKNYKIADDGDLVDVANGWEKIYEMTASGAVLVRPDGHVAWRSKSMVDDPNKVLKSIFKKILMIDK